MRFAAHNARPPGWFICLLLLLWPATALAANPQVAPGGSATFPPTFSHSLPGPWAVYNPSGTLIANGSGQSPGTAGWNVTFVSGQYNIVSITVTAPTAAAAGTGYTVVTAGPGSTDAAYFDVVVGAVPPSGPNLTGLSLSPNPATGGGSSTGTVTLSAAAPAGGTSISLTSSNASVASVPASVTVPAGATSAPFSIAAAAVTGSSSATITATGSTATYSQPLTVRPLLAGLSLSPNPATGGGSSTGTVTLSAAAPAGGTSISLTSSIASVASVPASVTVPAGATSAPFSASAPAVNGPASTTITAAYAGAAVSQVLTVNPAAGTAPAAPTGLAASAGSSSVALSWSPVNGANTYNVYRSTASGGEGATPYLTGVTASGPTITDTDSGVTAGQTYYYQATAVMSGVEGGKSNQASATPGSAALAAPVLKGAAGATSDALTWSAVSGATSYNLYRTVGGSYYGTLYQQGLTGTSFSDTGLPAGTSYSYYVCAVSTNGQGSQSNTVALTPGSAALAAPLLSAQSAGSTSVSLSWPSVAGASSYNVYRSATAGGEGATPYKVGAGSGNPTGFSYTDSGLTAGQTCYYKVVAVGPGGEGALSNEASATAGAAALPAPAGFTAVAAANSGQAIALTWTAVSGATSYNVYRGSQAVGTSPYAPVYCTLYRTGVTGTSCTDTGVAFGPKYTYYVCAVNTSGQGSPSTQASATLIGFGITAAPTPLAVTRGSIAAVSVLLTPSGGFTGPVVLSGAGLPAGVTAWYYPGSAVLPVVNAPEYQAGLASEGIGGVVGSGLYLAVSGSATPGNYTIQITGQSGSYTNTTSVVVTIN